MIDEDNQEQSQEQWEEEPEMQKKKKKDSFFRPKTLKGKAKLWLIEFAVSALVSMSGYILAIGTFTLVYLYITGYFNSGNAPAATQQTTQAPPAAK